MLYRRPKLGLALGSGSTRGFTMVGILKVLHENNIPIDYIAGTSVGAIIGGIYAKNRDINAVTALVDNFPILDLVKAFIDPTFKEGLVSGVKFRNLLEKYVDNINIEDLEIPFNAVASDKITGDRVVFKKGSLVNAMRASSSIPIAFTPYDHNGLELLDGGVVEQVPVPTAKEMGAEKIIAVNLAENIDYNPKSSISTMLHYLQLLFKVIARENCKDADIVLSPEVTSALWVDNYKERHLLVQEGERIAKKALPQIIEALKPGIYL